jgi:hypothetical protein
VTDTPIFLAVVLEFDDILAPDSTSTLLKQRGLDPAKFWSEDVKALIEAGYDPVPACLAAILDNIGEQKALGALTNETLMKLGRHLDETLYPGLPQLFVDLRVIAMAYKRIELEFYVISSGLQDLIEGSAVIQEHFRGVYGSQLAADSDGPVLRHIKRCVTFTEKTRYLFEISKDIPPRETMGNPLNVNRYVPPQSRKIPFRNMIFVGDALVDVPCFSIIKRDGGLTFGVRSSKARMSPKQALESLLSPERPMSTHLPNFDEQSPLGALLRAAVATRCSQIQLEREEMVED